MNEWIETELGEVVELKRGYDLPQKHRKPGNIPVVSSSGITGFHSQAKVKKPGVVTGRYGTIGKVFFINQDFWPLNTTLYVKDFKKNYPRFISYFLTKINYLMYSDKVAVPGVNRNHLHKTLIKFPPDITEQKAIASILGALDDKIEHNNKMNETLETMARALYKSWFVDFDPVVAKAAGKRPFGMDDETAALFPDRFVDSELGPIPEGWKITQLKERGRLEYGKSLPAKKRIPGKIEVVGSNGTVGFHDAPLVKGPGLVVGRKGTVGTVSLILSDFWPIDTTFYFIPNRTGQIYFHYYLLSSIDLPSLSGDSAVPGLNREVAYQQNTVFPSDTIIEAFEHNALGWYTLIENNIEESQTLSKLRDLLLPKLISGEIRIKDAEKVVEEAL